jgi:hypothetical protein
MKTPKPLTRLTLNRLTLKGLKAKTGAKAGALASNSRESCLGPCETAGC